MTRAVAILALMGMWGCDAALVDGTWPGDPLVELSGDVRFVASGGHPGRVGEAPSVEGTLRLALVWANLTTDDRAALVTGAEQQALTVAELPARYSLSLYAPPPIEASQVGYALGVLIAYADVDDDGVWTADADTLVGAVPDRVLIYDWGFRVTTLDSAVRCADPGAPLAGLSPDPSAAWDLMIDTSAAASLLPDLNCDGEIGEWHMGGGTGAGPMHPGA